MEKLADSDRREMPRQQCSVRRDAQEASRHREAFTLVELLVVVAILALLASLLIPSLVRAKAQAKRIHCSNNLHHLGLALALYTQNYQSKYPY